MLNLRTIKKHKRHRSSAVSLPILMMVALRNLSSKRLRTTLTVGGIMIGVGSTVFLASLANGLHNVVNEQVIGSSSVKTIDITTPNAANIPLDINRTEDIKDIAHVTTVAPSYVTPGKVSNQGSITDAVLYGTNNDFIQLSALKNIAGKNSLDSENDVVISKSLLSLIGQSDAKSAIGQNIDVLLDSDTNDTEDAKPLSDKLIISGVVDVGKGTAIYISDSLFTNTKVENYGQVKVVADERINVSSIRDQISGFGLSSTSPLDTLDEINTIFKIFTFVVIGFGGIGMIIAILGMFNTLTISLLERTSEIGLMITMGARKADVKRLLSFEAMLLSLLGSIAGIIGAGIVGLIINKFLTHFAHNRGVEGSINALSITPSLVVVAIAVTMLVGSIVALYPSRRASRINPITALRNE